MNETSLWTWMAPTLAALVLYGVGQGLVKKYIAEVAPARYCLFFFFAKSVVNLGYFLYSAVYLTKGGLAAAWQGVTPAAMACGCLSYVLEGIGWICYYESIVAGPIAIVGTLSAAYAAPAVVFAYLLLGESLAVRQYQGVALVILGCVGLSYAPPDPDARIAGRRWIPLALAALALWGFWQTGVKYTYRTFGTTDAQMAVFNIIGAFSTLGLYGILWGRAPGGSSGEWARAFVPMAVMAAGDLGVIIATQTGKVGIVTPISGAYPVVTLVFARLVLHERITRIQMACVAATLAGMFLSIPELTDLIGWFRELMHR